MTKEFASIILLVTAGLTTSSAGDMASDHLVPVPNYSGSAPLYRKLWSQKLLLTPGDTARFVQLPGSQGVEKAVSVYQDVSRPGALPGGYWVTVTEPSGALSDCYPAIKNHDFI